MTPRVESIRACRPDCFLLAEAVWKREEVWRCRNVFGSLGVWIAGLELSCFGARGEHDTAQPRGGGRPLPGCVGESRAAPSAVRAPLPAPSGAVAKPARASGPWQGNDSALGPSAASEPGCQSAPGPDSPRRLSMATPSPHPGRHRLARRRHVRPPWESQRRRPRSPTLKLAPAPKRSRASGRPSLSPRSSPDRINTRISDPTSQPDPGSPRARPGGAPSGSTASDRKATMLDNPGRSRTRPIAAGRPTLGRCPSAHLRRPAAAGRAWLVIRCPDGEV